MRLPGASRDEPLIGAVQTTGLAGGYDFVNYCENRSMKQDPQKIFPDQLQLQDP